MARISGGTDDPVETGTNPATLSDRAYELIKSAILSNQLPPGTSLSVPELARQLSVSRTPVRDAVQRLIYDGLASHVLNRGAVVSSVDIEDLRELYLVREQLEGLAARLATERTDAAGLARLGDIIEEHQRALDAGADGTAHIQLDMKFHCTIRELAANAHLSSALEPIAGRSHLALHSLWRTEDAPRLALEEHHAVLRAMLAGDTDMAEAAARRHISRLRTRLAHAALADPHAPRGARVGRPRIRLVARPAAEPAQAQDAAASTSAGERSSAHESG